MVPMNCGTLPAAMGLLERVMSSGMTNGATDMIRRHRLTVPAYRRMAEAGILAPDARVELIEGEIIDMPPIGSRHAGTVKHLARVLQRCAGDLAIVQVQDPVSLDENSEPQADLALLRPRQDFYRSAHPGAVDVLLIIEVADVSLHYHSEVKVPLYARHGIPEVWIADLNDRRLMRYRDPRDGAYAQVDVPELAEPISVSAEPGLRVDLSGVM
jgi:Uma2 family endonuclease